MALPNPESYMLEQFMSFRYECSGEASFEDGYRVDVRFVLRMHKNGSISGDLEFLTFDSTIWSYYHKMSEFTLKGQESHDLRSVRACRCYLVGINRSEKKATIKALQVTIGDEVLAKV
jgi:hypothetical protein